MRYFVNSIIFKVSHRLLYCVFINPNAQKSYKMLQKLSPKHAVSGVAQSPYPIYSHGKACLNNLPWSAAGDPHLARGRSWVRAWPPHACCTCFFSPPSLPSFLPSSFAPSSPPPWKLSVRVIVDFKKQKMLEIFVFLQKYRKVNLERETQHAVITHANTSNGIKILTFFRKSWRMMLYLSNAPLLSRPIWRVHLQEQTNAIPKLSFLCHPVACITQFLMSKYFLAKNWQSPVCLPANTYAVSQKMAISTTFAGWHVQINSEMVLVGFCKWTLYMVLDHKSRPESPKSHLAEHIWQEALGQ